MFSFFEYFAKTFTTAYLFISLFGYILTVISTTATFPEIPRKKKIHDTCTFPLRPSNIVDLNYHNLEAISKYPKYRRLVTY